MTRVSPLVPFAATGPHTRLRLACAVEREGSVLAVSWRLAGDLSTIALPAPAARPARLDGLWRGTCFELFLGLAGEPAYREFNLSPSGDWNAYRFDAPRRGGRPDDQFRELPFTARLDGDLFEVDLRLPLAGIAVEPATLEIGPAAVLAGTGGEVSHWALRHEGPAPDFHRRSGFLLRR